MKNLRIFSGLKIIRKVIGRDMKKNGYKIKIVSVNYGMTF